jgi:hypothetical protein
MVNDQPSQSLLLTFYTIVFTIDCFSLLQYSRLMWWLHKDDKMWAILCCVLQMLKKKSMEEVLADYITIKLRRVV